MNENLFSYYNDLGIKRNELNNLNDILKVPTKRLTTLARESRVEALDEALSWKGGEDQDNRIITKLVFV